MSELLTAAGAPYTMAEAMAMLDCSEDVVVARIQRGEVPALKFGRSWIFPRDAFVHGLNVMAEQQRVARRAAHELKMGATVTLTPAEVRQASRAAAWANYRAATMRREPPWACREAVREMYLQARRMTKATGIEHHVDHDVPLKGELVSGLHVPANLRVITGTENHRKKNRFKVG